MVLQAHRALPFLPAVAVVLQTCLQDSPVLVGLLVTLVRLVLALALAAAVLDLVVLLSAQGQQEILLLRSIFNESSYFSRRDKRQWLPCSLGQ
jgi:hypothetical protein